MLAAGWAWRPVTRLLFSSSVQRGEREAEVEFVVIANLPGCYGRLRLARGCCMTFVGRDLKAILANISTLFDFLGKDWRAR